MDIYIVKDNLINNLCTGIIPHILDGFTSIYEDAVRVNPKNPFERYKRFLLDIKTWPERIVVNESKRIIAQFKMLRKVLKTINYINIKSLALIGKHNISVDDAYISKNTPSVYMFIHKVYMNSAKEFFHDDALLNFTISGTRSRQSTVIESVIKQILNESVPMNDLLFNINDDTEESLTKVVLNQKPDIDEHNNDETEDDDTIVIENTRDNNHSIIKDNDLDMLEETINESIIESTINESSTNFLNNKKPVEESESIVNEHGFSELLEKTGMNLLDTSSKMEPASEKIDIVASVVSPTPSTSGKSQTVLLQPSFINNDKSTNHEKTTNKEKDESSSKISKSGRKMVSLRKKKSNK